MTPLDTLATHPARLSLQNEDRRAQASLTSSNLRIREGFLTTSTNQTKTWDGVSYEHWIQVHKPSSEYLGIHNFWSSEVHVPLQKHILIKIN
jgi:hypothetical protein